MLTASMSVLDYASKYKEELLYNRYQAGRDQIRRYESNPPYAYVDPAAAARSGRAGGAAAAARVQRRARSAS